MNFLEKLLRAGEGKKVRELSRLAEDVNKLEPLFAEMSDKELSGSTERFRERFENGETLESLMPEAFAAVREASKRTIGQRHFDVQIMGGGALFGNNIAEMKTGEGKTLVATLPAYLGAIASKGVHIVTVNDYLASYQSELMGRIFRFLGMKTGCILSTMTPEQRRAEYACDITYGTNNEFGFDYLRDNMALSKDQLVQRGHFFAIVDEVDSILIDEARTPLIISGHAAGDLNAQYQDFARFVQTLSRVTNIDPNKTYLPGEEKPIPNGDYEVDEKRKTVGVLDSAIDKLEAHLGIENLYDSVNTPLVQFLQNAIRAKELFIRDRDYIVANGEVKIVDEHTGRVLDGRRYNEGMHQAIEAKEGVKIQAENQTYATITLQNYFRLYDKLAGMTGTAETEAAEFASTYQLGVIPIPTNRPMVREDKPDYVFRSESGKFAAIVEEVRARHEIGQPVLLGTASVEKSEQLSLALKHAGIVHNVLNAKQHDREAAVIAMAGRKNAVTVATNMAGRGTDIMLGGNSEFLARQEMIRLGFNIEEDSDKYDKEWPKVLKKMQEQVQSEHDEVAELGGLYVIGTERHESRRIDNQLRGRSGRQGDKGESRFFISMEDDLMRLFNSARAQQVMAMVDFPEDQPIENSLLTKSIRNAQSQVEARNFEIRKNVLKYDEVMNKQRKVVYSERQRVLEGADISKQVRSFIDQTLQSVIFESTAEGAPETWDLDKLWRELKAFYPISITAEEVIEVVGKIGSLTAEDLIREVLSDAQIQYDRREVFAGEQIMRDIERNVTLQVLDRAWRQHLASMDYLREGIGLRAMAQKDPLVEYTNEAARAFSEMNSAVQSEIVQILFNVGITLTDNDGNSRQLTPENQIVITGESGPSENSQGSNTKKAPAKTSNKSNGAVSAKTQVKQDGQTFQGVAKNAPCPCSSGKKYKACHGRD